MSKSVSIMYDFFSVSKYITITVLRLWVSLYFCFNCTIEKKVD